MIYGQRAKQIADEIARDPKRNSVQIAAAIGSNPEYVRTVARRHGLDFGTKKNEPFLGAENDRWLRREARRAGVTRKELMRAIITDARMEDIN